MGYGEKARKGLQGYKASNGLILDSVSVSYPFSFYQYNLTGGQVVGGSNPLVPTIFIRAYGFSP